MKVLVLGSGAREHALVWRLAQDPDVSAVLAAPGNPGMASLARCFPVDPSSTSELLAIAEREAVALTVVGPEGLLAAGVADLFRQAGLPIVGPSRAAAALESSKVFSKEFMARHRIPTSRFLVCDTLPQALAAVAGPQFGWPVVIKADGLAAGKGVVVAENRAEAEKAVRAAMIDKQFGDAGGRLVIEECLTGPEVSFFALIDGANALALGTAQDHKRIFDDDKGPNTGGMGAFAPSPLVDDTLTRFVVDRIAQPVINGMRAEGHPYNGFLYVGLMLTPAGPQVIEFNVRFGDPEAQVILPLVEGSFARTLLAAANGRLLGEPLHTSSDRTVGVVIASRGYPASSESGRPIEGLDRASVVPGVLVFHAATAANAGRTVTAGGRVLTVVGRAPDYAGAIARAYEAAALVTFEGMQFRSDIGRKALGAAGATE
jgi:phosphoribosylamine--glycine ligase